MNEKTIIRITIILLVVVSALFVGLRKVFLHPFRSETDHALWRLSYHIEFGTIPRTERIRISLPHGSGSNRVFRESFSHSGFSMDIQRNRRTGDREAVMVTSGVRDKMWFQAEFDIITGTGFERPVLSEQPLSVVDRAYYLQTEKHIPVHSPMANSVLKKLTADHPKRSQLPERICSYCFEDIGNQQDSPLSGTVEALVNKSANPCGAAMAMVTLCRTAGIPARLVCGFILSEPERKTSHIWVEAYIKGRWKPYDPYYGYRGELPGTFVRVSRDSRYVVKASVPIESVTCETIQLSESNLPRSEDNGFRWCRIFDLTRMPVGMQSTLGLILLLPLGALVTALFRNIIGIQTYGTFTPSLFALSLAHKHILTGLMIFVFVLITGIAGRLIINRLQLLMVSRLGLVLLVTVLSIVFSVSVMASLGMTPTAHAVLIPAVILTIMIERFFIKCEEDGLVHALKLMAGTLTISFFSLAIFKIHYLEEMLLHYPELLLAVAALLIATGRYSGYRLTELFRFRDIAASPAAQDKGDDA